MSVSSIPLIALLKTKSLVTVQDSGRRFVQHLGYAAGGWMDDHAALLANVLLGNAPNQAVLEIMPGTTEIEILQSMSIAITGANLDVRLNGQQLPLWQSLHVNVGDTIEFGWARQGVRSYLALPAKINSHRSHGSQSVVPREHLKGMPGGPLQSGALISGVLSESVPVSLAKLPTRFIPDYRKGLVIRVIPDGQHDQFNAEALGCFQKSEFQISSDQDRMGIRLRGPEIMPPVPGILSEPMPFGAIQITPDGQPVLMHKDRQTLGGYPKIGTALPMDAWRISQMQANQSVRFMFISVEDATALMKDFYRFIYQEAPQLVNC